MDPVTSAYDSLAQGVMLAFVLIALACPICTAIVASTKGRSVGSWFVIGLLFGPFGLLAAVGVPPYDIHAERARAGRPSRKQICPNCDEAASVNAFVCPHCGTELAEDQSR